MKPYVKGQKLEDDEYVIKIRSSRHEEEYPTAFLAKLTKKNELMKSFEDWGNPYSYFGDTTKEPPLPIFVVKETFRTGWKLESWRFGESQNWARVIHPDGYALEIYLTNFLDIALNNTIVNGEIQGQFKWENRSLVSPKK